MSERFHVFARSVAEWAGSRAAFILAGATVLVWLAVGPVFAFSDTWQLVINTGTTIVTFLMVFVIQNTQNRDARAMHLKLDELIKGVTEARTGMVNLEEMPDEHLDALQDEMRAVAEQGSVLERNLSSGRFINARPPIVPPPTTRRGP